MLKKFFISMLGTLAGIWISIIVIILGSLMVIGVIGAKFLANSGAMNVSGKNNILHVELKGSIPEREESGSIRDIILGGGEQVEFSLQDLLTAVRNAKDDKTIKGIFLDCGGASMGFAAREELREALADFKSSGKWVWAYADSYAQGDYLTATIADKIVVNPSGEIDIHGLLSQTMFYKDLMDKLGVEVQVVKVGTYKSAVEPFLRSDMSEPSRMQTEIFLNNIWNSLTAAASTGLGTTPAAINSWADSLCFTWPSQRYVDNNMVAELKYRHDFENMLREKVGIDSDADLPLVSVSDYALIKSSENVVNSGKKHIAVLYACGDIVDSGDGGIVAKTLVPQIYKLAEDKNVKGLVLRVNSGGGSAFASEQIWKALEDFKAKGKPFYVSMGDYAASGGYYISCGADSIFADDATITGSIGIFGMIPSAKGLIQDKLGLKVASVETNPGANMMAPYEPLTPRQLAAMQSYVENGYDLFTRRVAEGRHIPQDSVKVIGEGRVWDGRSALNIGLVDKIASLDYAVKSMAKKLDIKPTHVVVYPEIEPDIWNLLMSQMNGVSLGLEGLPLDEAVEVARIANSFGSQSPIQARMDPIFIR